MNMIGCSLVLAFLLAGGGVLSFSCKSERKPWGRGSSARHPARTTLLLAGVAVAGGPPGGPRGGPPPPTRSQKILEKVFGAAFPLLYLGDRSGIRDSSKNLRVLWTRALLHSLGRIDDPVARELLPRRTRFVVGRRAAGLFWKGTAAVDKLAWIADRTRFIDSQVEEFIRETTGGDGAARRQIVLIGAGYDTRALRFAGSDIDFYEVDLPEIIATKTRMVDRFLEGDPAPAGRCGIISYLPLDLNEVVTKEADLVGLLRAEGLRDDLPTMVVSEAVLFYLIPGAVQKIVTDLFGINADRYCITDNLAKVGVAPGPPIPSPREKCEAWLKENGKEMTAHESIWNGAIHFVGAK